ncbi:MAG: diphosphomevalonate decarboxylase [Candidatus Anstonellaceae archaeon]
MEEVVVSAFAPTNIAIIKYWGKHLDFENYFIPTKSSASFCVDKFFTTTILKVHKSNSFKITLNLNNRKILQNEAEFVYVQDFFLRLSEFIPQIKNYSFFINSKNNFPTAAGFASSASGFAALARGIATAFEHLEPKIFEKFFSTDEKLSSLARLGSGSASRSIPRDGGFVLWERGYDKLSSNPTKEDILFCSFCKSLFNPNHWPELKVIYVALEKKEKKVKSRIGMQQSLKTNPLYYNWVEYEEKTLLPSLIQAIKTKDFEKFAAISISASNYLHSIMLGSFPPLIYLNDKSKEIIELILELNKDKLIAAYTFDAGPNPVIFTLEKNKNKVLQSLNSICRNVFVQNIAKGSSGVVEVE